jgi:hypothetical protein
MERVKKFELAARAGSVSFRGKLSTEQAYDHQKLYRTAEIKSRSAATAILNLHEHIENKLFLDRTRKDSNFKRPHICATLFQIEKCCCGLGQPQNYVLESVSSQNTHEQHEARACADNH